MMDLILKMIYWLIAAMIVGFVVAWLLAKLHYKKREETMADDSAAIVLERNNMIDKLEQKFRDEKVNYEELSEELIKTKVLLAEKTSHASTLQNKLNKINGSTSEIDALRTENNLLGLEVKRISNLNQKISKEFSQFEAVLLRAEDKLEESKQGHQQLVKSLDREIETLTKVNQKQKQELNEDKKVIASLQDELQLYLANHSDPEFIISQDQFMKIEEQLKEYQEEIDRLKEENKELCSKAQKNGKVYSTDLVLAEPKVTEVNKKSKDDSSMVKVFRDTYRKITKS